MLFAIPELFPSMFPSTPSKAMAHVSFDASASSSSRKRTRPVDLPAPVFDGIMYHGEVASSQKVCADLVLSWHAFQPVNV